MQENTVENKAAEISVKAADDKLDKLAKIEAITESGCNWLRVALDPFHDVPTHLEGQPDNSTGLSVVQKIVKTIQIQPPTGLAATDTWDCSVISWPELSYAVGATYQYNGTAGGANRWNLFQTPINDYIGGVTYSSVKSGSVTLPMQNSGGVTAVSNGVRFLDSDVDTNQPCRAIARAFEVVNTTSALNRQGAVYCWQTPNEYQESLGQAWIGSGGTPAAPTNVYDTTFRASVMPPSTIDEVSVTMDSRLWEAEKGCYCVSRFDASQNYVAEPASLNTLYEVECWPYLASYNAVSQAWITSTYGSSSKLRPLATIRTPFNIHGAYFVGLSPQTTLTLRAVCFLEVFPKCTSNLVTLATPSAPYDSMALDMYSEAIRKLPVGVPFSMNPLGEWFEDVVDTIAGAAGPALGAASLIFPEFAPVLAPLGAAAAGIDEMVVKPYMTRARAKRQKKKNKQKLKKLEQAEKSASRSAQRVSADVKSLERARSRN